MRRTTDFSKLALRILLIALLIVTTQGCNSPVADAASKLIRTFRYEAFRIPSGGMLPTLEIGDEVYASKSAYRTRDPVRGEIVVFKVGRNGVDIAPLDQHPDWEVEIFIKRVLAVPGDEVEWRNEQLILNGAPAKYSETGRGYEPFAVRQVPILETDSGSVPHQILVQSEHLQPEVSPTRIRPGRYFLVGDFRTSSHDSRHWGSVRKEELIGPVVYRYYSGDTQNSGFVWEDLRLEE